ncbi:platelet-activating factor acetylhydrolase isoform X3 [Cherax quadricarinatus]|uniref:platelet-activating factor acetylhydrolase isoform X3 n=1 Tax=Cherax quadricarinatus TaxID=27406 RepID=UPI00237970AB|nr:platelet-activating factor acetylhydrolase-like isoform X3 [Cherax quadricarinatus]
MTPGTHRQIPTEFTFSVISSGYTKDVEMSGLHTIYFLAAASRCPTSLGGVSIQFMKTMAGKTCSRFTNHTPLPQGPHVVGATDIMIGRTKDGTLMRLYYPSKLTDLMSHTEKWTPWFLGEEYTRGLASFIAPSIPSLFSMLFNWQMRGVATPAVWGAPVTDRKFPVIVFSHGLSAHRSIYSTVCTELASHGFFVAAVEHRDRSACASFTLNETGEKEYMLFKTTPLDMKEYELRNQQIKIRVEESIRALNVLEMLNEGKVKNELSSDFDLQQLHGHLDLTYPIMTGHSFGGVTAISTLAKDKRFKVGVALDPWMFPIKDEVDNIGPNVTQPLMCISTEAFQSIANLQAMGKLNKTTTEFITIKGTVHQNQCDTPFLVGHIGRVFVGASSPLDPQTAMDINNRLMLNFIAKHIGDQGTTINTYVPYLEIQQDNMVYGLHGKGKAMLGWDEGYTSV